jgi:hypothetical protein
LFCTLSRGLDYISNANPACSCDYFENFSFALFTPPSRRLSPLPRKAHASGAATVLLPQNACAKFQRKTTARRAVSSARHPLSRHDLALRLAEPPPEPRPAGAPPLVRRGELVSSFLSPPLSSSPFAGATGARLSRPGRPRLSSSGRSARPAALTSSAVAAASRFAGEPRP